MPRTLIEIFSDELPKTLTDLARAQWVFKQVFDRTKIGSILEVGVCAILGGGAPEKAWLYGQSTKILMMLAVQYGSTQYLSIDTDDCSETVKKCKEWLRDWGQDVPDYHQFVKTESLALDVGGHFPRGIDLVFLDSSHDWRGCEQKYKGGSGYTYKEICHFAPHVTPSGCILLHDTFNNYVPEGYGANVSGAIQRFVAENPDWIFTEHRPNGNGLGELRRK
jgi:hypothetical protein